MSALKSSMKTPKLPWPVLLTCIFAKKQINMKHWNTKIKQIAKSIMTEAVFFAFFYLYSFRFQPIFFNLIVLFLNNYPSYSCFQTFFVISAGHFKKATEKSATTQNEFQFQGPNSRKVGIRTCRGKKWALKRHKYLAAKISWWAFYRVATFYVSVQDKNVLTIKLTQNLRFTAE